MVEGLGLAKKDDTGDCKQETGESEWRQGDLFPGDGSIPQFGTQRPEVTEI